MSSAETQALPTPEEFFRAKPTLKPLQHTSDELRAFVEQFHDVKLSPKGAETLAELSRLLENEAWCASHDAAHEAMKTALKMVETEAHAGGKLAIETISKAQMPNNATITSMVKNEALANTLKPLQSHLAAYNTDNMKWMQCRAGSFKITEGEAATTLTDALSNPPQEKPKATAPKPATSKPAASKPLGEPPSLFSGGGGYVDFTPSSSAHACGDPGCASCGLSSSSSSYGGSYGGYIGDSTTAATEAARERGTWLQEMERWLRQQKPQHVILTAGVVAAGTGLLYLSGKSEQRRRAAKDSWQEMLETNEQADTMEAVRAS